MENVAHTIISQYQNSPTIRQLIVNVWSYLDLTLDKVLGTDSGLIIVLPDGSPILTDMSFAELFIRRIWDLNTADGYGLDIWGRIVGVSRVLQIANTEFLGFRQSIDAQTFGRGVFYAGNSLKSNYVLLDDDFRTLIFAKALANISDGSIPSINRILLALFPGRGNCYIRDNGDMTADYIFTFRPTLVERAILFESGILPRPTGVRIGLVLP